MKKLKNIEDIKDDNEDEEDDGYFIKNVVIEEVTKRCWTKKLNVYRTKDDKENKHTDRE